MNKCCPNRDDQCYINHFDTRCYCDIFCTGKVDKWNDCCPDADEQCRVTEMVNLTFEI